MNKLFRIFIVLLVIAIAAWGFSYSYIWYFKYTKKDRDLTNLTAAQLANLPEKERNKIKEMKKLRSRIINLGLDLQGGLYMVLQPDYEELKKRRGGQELSQADVKDAMRRVMEILRNRIDKFGVSEPSITTQGEDRIVIELPGSKDPDRAKNIVMGRGLLEFKLVDEDTTAKLRRDMFDEDGNLIDKSVIPKTSELRYYWEKNKYGILEKKRAIVLYKKTLLDGSYIKRAQVQTDQFGKPEVVFSLSSEGAKKFAEITGSNVGKMLAIVLDGKILSMPVIRERISGGNVRITGNFTMNEAKDLALILRAGAFPVPLEIVEERTVGPTLGEDSIKSGIKAAIIGSILVLGFMLLYYKLSGFIADIAVILNMFILLGILAWLNFTLTLSGIAGMILTVGMAVDANVIIFERIKEELRSGKTIAASIQAGYDKAFRTILDANMTTLIATFVLSQFGSGPIKGFAVTLSIGIVINMFTSIFVTRLLYDIGIDLFKVKKLSI
ncbi:MAG: protein translocase subunit SecD [Spirochaetes bacterium]|nr:MAG: protein translocase subunit SecD [Spirochaetota bacterium]RKY00553.1 MAG: protein translocase subunit SecD [Spirochaetota bacterium]